MSKATKTIKTTITIVMHDDKKERVEKAPGDDVTLPADEADRILARFGGVEVKAEKSAKGKSAQDDDEAAKAAAEEAAKRAAEEEAAKEDAKKDAK